MFLYKSMFPTLTLRLLYDKVKHPRLIIYIQKYKMHFARLYCSQAYWSDW